MISHSHIHIAVLLLTAMVVGSSVAEATNQTAANSQDEVLQDNRRLRNAPSGSDCDFNQDFYMFSAAKPSTSYIRWYKSLQSASSSSSSIKNHHANKQGVLRVQGRGTSSTVTITLYVYNPVSYPFHIADSPLAYGSSSTTFAEIIASGRYLFTFTKGTTAYQRSTALVKTAGYSTYQIQITRSSVYITRTHPPSEQMNLFNSYMFVMNQYIYIAINRFVKDGWNGAGVYHVCINAN